MSASFPADEFFDDLDGTCADEVDWGDADADDAVDDPKSLVWTRTNTKKALTACAPIGLVGSIGHGTSSVGGSHDVAMEDKRALAYARFHDLRWQCQQQPLQVSYLLTIM